MCGNAVSTWISSEVNEYEHDTWQSLERKKMCMFGYDLTKLVAPLIFLFGLSLSSSSVHKTKLNGKFEFGIVDISLYHISMDMAKVTYLDL